MASRNQHSISDPVRRPRPPQVWLFNARGGRRSFALFQFTFSRLIVQLSIAVVYGLGPGLGIKSGSAAAAVQVVIICLLQVTAAATVSLCPTIVS